jgi:hypothetical protein
MVEREEDPRRRAIPTVRPSPTTKHGFLGHYGWIQKQLIELKDQQTKLALQQNASRNTANRRGPDCFICCGRRKRHRRGFAKTEVFKHIFPKSGNHQLRATNYYSRTLSAGSSIIT